MNRLFKIKSTSFEINNLITKKLLFSQVKISLSARLVLRCITDFWNYKMCCAYPTQKTIASCTGLTDVAVVNAVKELSEKDLITKHKHHKRIYYYYTLKFLTYLNLTSQICLEESSKSFNNMHQQHLDKNIIKENENTSFQNLSEQITGKQMAEILINRLGNSPAFAKKVAELKEKYNL